MSHSALAIERVNAFCTQYELRIPILMAPMAGACPPALAIAVGNAGGMGDARHVAAAITLGASAVQIGTGLLRSPEAAIHQTWSGAIANAQPEDTIATKAFSGRLGRSIRGTYAESFARNDTPEPAPYPIQRNLTRALRDDAIKTSDINRL